MGTTAAARVMVARAGERQKIRSRGLGEVARVEEVRGLGPESCEADEEGAEEEEGPKGLAFPACGHRSKHGFCKTCRGFYG
ncbi:hypothetical protein Tdes44962_MAKER10543 [Teratosphaeria destructans]|uniref:Uncharacterized protein n=1 Tax=Teratosphaeria destructans TaxID=418781 RepID=A0A9W7W5P6_9PEZI|nr:hypothetical protein Tdes44962_MAKER10543 [Teratosphaeria destructans]